jgi:hypothetical protein
MLSGVRVSSLAAGSLAFLALAFPAVLRAAGPSTLVYFGT